MLLHLPNERDLFLYMCTFIHSDLRYLQYAIKHIIKIVHSLELYVVSLIKDTILSTETVSIKEY